MKPVRLVGNGHAEGSLGRRAGLNGASLESLNSLLECLAEGAVVSGEDGVILLVNSALERMFGYDAGELLGSGVDTLVPGSLRSAHAEHRRRYAARPERRPMGSGREFIAVRKDGAEVPVEVSLSPVPVAGPGVVMALVCDISERKRAERERERLLAERAYLTQRLLQAQEEERRRLTYEIHDGPVQQMAAARMHLQSGELKLSSEGSRQAFADLRAAKHELASAVRELRRILANLRPPNLDDFGLAGALRQYLKEVGRRSHLDLEFHCDAEALRLQPADEIALFRIAQEAITNAERHSGSGRLRVRLALTGRSLILEIKDWGTGFAPEPPRTAADDNGFGLRGIRERAGLIGADLRIKSSKKAGTTIAVELALPEANPGLGWPLAEGGSKDDHVPGNHRRHGILLPSDPGPDC
jgi:two-component system sensor histidine kinase NreB